MRHDTGGDSLNGYVSHHEARRHHDPTTNEMQLISEATQVATIAAKSILNSGGSQATALKTAKAAAKSTLMGRSAGPSDNGSVSSSATSSSISNWGQKRKIKRQAEVVASMAVATASNTHHFGGQAAREPPNHYMHGSQSHRAPSVSGPYSDAMLMPTESPVLSGTIDISPRRPPLSPSATSNRSKASAPSGTNSIPPLPPMPPQSQQKQNASSPEPTKMLHNISSAVKSDGSLSASTLTTERTEPTQEVKPNNKEISAVDCNSEDPIYWDNRHSLKSESETRSETTPKKSTKRKNSPSPRKWGRGRGKNKHEIVLTLSESSDSKGENVFYETASDGSDDYTFDATLDETYITNDDADYPEDYAEQAVERSLSPFFSSFDKFFGCSCNNSNNKEKLIEAEKREEEEKEEEEKEEAKDDDENTVPVVDERDIREETFQKKPSEDYRTGDDEEEVYHTIVLKSRFEPRDGALEVEKSESPQKSTAPTSPSKAEQPIVPDKTRRKKNKLFRRKRE